VLRDIDPMLADRIKRLADARGWTMHDTLQNAASSRGCSPARAGQRALQRSRGRRAASAISAMEGVQTTGLRLIGRAPEAPPPQHILERVARD
jgi:hypothetical protein